MDRVPIRFIEEVVLQLVDNYCFMDREYPSIWGRVASKLTRKKAYLHLYLKSKEQAYFYVDDYDRKQVELDRIGQFIIVNIKVEDKKNKGWDIFNPPKFHPLTKKNFQLLQNLIRKPFPCFLGFDFQTDPIHPLVQRLCLAIPRVVKLYFNSQVPLSMDILTRSIERGTLSDLSCHTDVTKETLPVLLRFMASEKMNELMVFRSRGCSQSVSYETLFDAVVDAILNKERGCHIQVDERCRNLCGRLKTMRGKFSVNFRYVDDCIFVRSRK
uniref:RNA-directed DNA polymerase-like protein n=1 Tax=Steinernema glaseri TaxID=37863 RepID=A0A1I8ADC5_9BILA